MRVIKLLAIVCVIVFFVLFGRAMRGSYSYKSPELKVAQYSDKTITTSAVALDTRFQALAFSPVKNNADGGFRSNLASIIESIKSIFRKNETVSRNEHGTWLWTPTLAMSDDYMEDILNTAKSESVDTLYLSIDSYLDIFIMEDGPKKVALKDEFIRKVEKFISLASERGISVDAEAGWRNWAEPGHVYKPLAIANFVIEYNNTHQVGFRGLQYDIEPYLLDEYKTNPERVLYNFVSLVDQTIEHLNDKVALSVVIPEFFDKKDRQSPFFSYNGSKNSAFGHLLNILDKRTNSSIIIMSYRNFAKGKDGSIEVSKNEMRTAKLGRHSTKIVLAQETGDVEPDYITFFNTSKPYFYEQIGILEAGFDHNSSFGGTAVHYANAYFGLK